MLKFIKFPDGEFTVGDLERANEGVLVPDVRVRLAEAIANGDVDVISRHEINGQVHGSFAYRKTSRPA